MPGPAGAIVLVSQHGGGIVGINHCCPCGCGRWGYMALKESGASEFWERTGDDWEHLTLPPSIGFMNKPVLAS